MADNTKGVAMRAAGILIVLGFLLAVGSCGTKPGDTGSPGQAETGSVLDDETIPASETTGRKPSPDEKRLHDAAKAGDIEAVKALLTQGVDINAKNVFAYTPLCDAIRTNQVKVARLLIAKGAKVDAMDQYGNTALFVAAWRGRVDSAQVLIAGGAKVDARNRQRETPLFSAARNHQIEGMTPICDAARNDQVEVAKLLLSKGAKVNATDKRGLTALHVAAADGNRDFADFLIARGVDPNAKDAGGSTPLHYAVSQARNRPASEQEWYRGVVALLIARGADVNGKNKQGYTALHWAIDDTDMGEFLIAKGADVNARTVEGKTPLYVCAESCPYDKPESHLAFAKMLIAHGADVNAKGPGGAPPIQWPRNRAMTILLAENGSDLSWAGFEGRTALHWAVCSLDAELARLLLSHGADVNVKDEDGWTPLDYALGDKSRLRGVFMCRPAPDSFLR